MFGRTAAARGDRADISLDPDLLLMDNRSRRWICHARVAKPHHRIAARAEFALIVVTQHRRRGVLGQEILVLDRPPRTRRSSSTIPPETPLSTTAFFEKCAQLRAAFAEISGAVQ
jgi:hypothetical protein